MFSFNVNELITLVSVVAAFLFINISEEILDRYYDGKLNLREQAISAIVIILGLRIASLWVLALAIIVVVLNIMIIALRKLMPQMAFSGYSVAVAGTIISVIRMVETKEGTIFMIASLASTIIAGIITALELKAAAEQEEDEDAEEENSSKGLTLVGFLTGIFILVVAIVGVAAWVVYSFNS